MAVRISVHSYFSPLRFSWALVPAPKFPDLALPRKPFKIVLTLEGNVNGNKVQN